MEYDKSPTEADAFGRFKVYTGLGLLGIGIYLGLTVAYTAFNLVKGEGPPGILARFAEPVVEQAIEVADGQELAQPFSVSPQVTSLAVYVICFLMLLIPMAVATGLIRAGAQLMHGDDIQRLMKLVGQIRS